MLHVDLGKGFIQKVVSGGNEPRFRLGKYIKCGSADFLRVITYACMRAVESAVSSWSPGPLVPPAGVFTEVHLSVD